MNELMHPAPIEAVIRQRDLALEALKAAVENIEAARTALTRLAPSVVGADSLEILKDLVSYRPPHWKQKADLQTHVDRLAWQELFAVSGIERLMDAKGKDEFRNQVRAVPVEATVENCRATIMQLHADAYKIFSRGVATSFSRLDRRFKSHDAFKFGTRIILSSAMSSWGGWSHHGHAADTIRDVERAIYILDGKQQPDYNASIAQKASDASRSETMEAEDDYFRVRVFQNGNLHIWLKRKDLLEKVNRVLADYYGAALSDAARSDGPRTRTTPARSFDFFPSPAEVVDRVISSADIRPGLRVLEPSAGKGALAFAAQDRGGHVTAIEIQAGLCADLQRDGLTVLHDDFLSVRPSPSMMFDRVVMNPPFGQRADVDHVLHALAFLKPGGRLVAVMAAGIEYREDRNTNVLRTMIERWGGNIRALPPLSFASVGTNVNTVVVTLNKPDGNL